MAELRPSLEDILHHAWFSAGPFPTSIPSSALYTEPEFPEMSLEEIKHNKRLVKKKSGIGANLPLRVPKAETVATTREVGKEVEKAIREQEREFNKAVQPDSPISALLRSAKKPPVVAPVHAPGSRAGESSNLLPKFQALQKQAGAASRGSPLRNEAGRAGPPHHHPSTKLTSHATRQEYEDEDIDMNEPETGVAMDKRAYNNILSPTTGRKINTAHLARSSNGVHTAETKKVSRTRVASNNAVKSPAASKTKRDSGTEIYDRVTANLTAAMGHRQRGEQVRIPGELPRAHTIW